MTNNSRHLTRTPLIWKLLSIAFLITLTACQTPTASTVPDQTDPGLKPTIAPTPSETEDAGYQVLNTNAMDPSVSLEWVKNPMWEPIYDFALGVDFTLFIPPGFVISYEYGKTGSENFLYLLYVAPEGIIKVQVDTLINFGSGIINSVKQMSDEEMQSFLFEFDEYFRTAKENGFVPYALRSDGTTLGVVSIGSEEGSINCLSNWDLMEPVGEFCAFDPGKGTLTNEESLDALISAFAPIGDLSLVELQNGDYEVYTLDENSSLFFQFSQPGEGSSSTW